MCFSVWKDSSSVVGDCLGLLVTKLVASVQLITNTYQKSRFTYHFTCTFNICTSVHMCISTFMHQYTYASVHACICTRVHLFVCINSCNFWWCVETWWLLWTYSTTLWIWLIFDLCSNRIVNIYIIMVSVFAASSISMWF